MGMPFIFLSRLTRKNFNEWVEDNKAIIENLKRGKNA
jgi:hypothetical protein